MKFGFVTCVQLGLSCMEEIYKSGGRLDLLITLKDKKAKNKSGRIYLDEFANKHSVDLIKINNVNDQEVVDTIKRKKIDWLFIIGWSQIAKPDLLKAPKKGCLGMHPTLLPTGRGRAAIPWAIIKGVEATGVTMFKLDDGVDTGEIVEQEVIPVAFDETATTLYEKVDKAHVLLMKKTWPIIIDKSLKLTTQDELKASYWEERRPEDGLITTAMTMQVADRLIRAVTHPYPGAFYYDDRGRKIVVWQARFSLVQGTNSFKLKDGYLIPFEYEVDGDFQ